jgi:4-amino-4-deoxy-L-arabinose transferase-like glycosyltransferase
MKIKSTTLYALLLGCVLLLRGFTLETVDLLDPTETRYATISANMNATGDYLTPMLVSGDAMDTYFSKPPLHYWLTSVSFHLFGVDEWSARLPRFLALLLISACLIVLGRNLVGVEVGLLAALMHESCPLVFYMAGGSHVDMTFAAWITLALTSFILLMELELTRAKRNEISILLAVASAAAFVTKGPLGLILIAGPPAIWMVLTRSRHKLKLLNWPLVILFLVGLGAPWFYLVELKNPGFLEYFFLHENFLRYIKHDYGGRHGANHTKPYGFIWVILAVGVLPFIVPFVLQSVKVLQTRVRALFHADQRLFFFLIWGLLPAAFFTLSSSILPAYLLLGLLLGWLTVGEAQAASFEAASERASSALEFLKGEPTQDQLWIGMASWHFNRASRHGRNWNQNLLGVQANDFFLVTFENSFYNRTFVAGWGRELSSHSLGEHWDSSFGYRLGLIYGYRVSEAPLSDDSPIIPLIEVHERLVYRDHFGVEIMLTTVLSASFFYQF